MDYLKSFSYIFEDDKWISKCLVSIAVMLVPILNFAWIGYSLQVVREVASGKSQLPDWDDLSKKWIDGFKLIAANWIYSLPALLILSIPLFFGIFPIFNRQR